MSTFSNQLNKKLLEMTKLAEDATVKSNWVSAVHTATVNTPRGVMTLPADDMVEVLLDANPTISLGSMIKFLQFYENRAGIGLPLERRNEIDKAKKILQDLNKKGRK